MLSALLAQSPFPSTGMATISFKQNLKPVRQLRARAQDLAREASCVRILQIAVTQDVLRVVLVVAVSIPVRS